MGFRPLFKYRDQTVLRLDSPLPNRVSEVSFQDFEEM